MLFGVNGDVLELTITTLAAASHGGYSLFLIRSTLGSAMQYWVGIVAD